VLLQKNAPMGASVTAKSSMDRKGCPAAIKETEATIRQLKCSQSGEEGSVGDRPPGRVLKNARNHLAADQRRLTPIENKTTYPRSSAFICGSLPFRQPAGEEDHLFSTPQD
jgi:hypothetical protein